MITQLQCQIVEARKIGELFGGDAPLTHSVSVNESASCQFYVVSYTEPFVEGSPEPEPRCSRAHLGHTRWTHYSGDAAGKGRACAREHECQPPEHGRQLLLPVPGVFKVAFRLREPGANLLESGAEIVLASRLRLGPASLEGSGPGIPAGNVVELRASASRPGAPRVRRRKPSSR
jgi:hypothetical protein